MVLKPLKLVTVLSLLLAVTFAGAVLALTVVLRVGVETRFQTYLDASQATTHGRIMGTLEGMHDAAGRWDREKVADLGRLALSEGLVLSVRGADGETVWDARSDSPAAVEGVFETLQARLQARSPWEKGWWQATEHPADTEHGAPGVMVLEVFQPRRLGPTDLAFLQGMDALWALTATAGVLLATLGGVVAGRGLARPLRRLQGSTRQLAEGDYRPPPLPSAPYAEVRELEVDLGVLAQRLDRLQTLRDTARADTAHELRTPLANLEAQLEALEDGVLPPSPERFAALGAETRRLKALVQAWEDLERAGEGEIGPACADASAVVRRVVETFRVRTAARGQSLTWETPAGGVPALGLAEADFGRILVNLIENAHRWAPEGGRIHVTLGADTEQYVLTVDDDGPGIPWDHRDAVFDRFYRVDASRSRASGGVGLGLSLVKALVQGAGGNVRAETSPWGGCRITVLPPGK